MTVESLPENENYAPSPETEKPVVPTITVVEDQKRARESYLAAESRPMIRGAKKELFGLNKSRFYEASDGKKFFAVPVRTTPNSMASLIAISKTEIGEVFPTNEEAEKTLDVLATCFAAALAAYEWKRPTDGFIVDGKRGVGMEQGTDVGLSVSFYTEMRPLAEALQSGDQALVDQNTNHLTASFIHEMTHRDFAEGMTGQEAVSQGMQFLFAPGDNPIFEKQVSQALEKLGKVLSGEEGALDVYELGNVVWMTKLWDELATTHPDSFPALTADGASTTKLLGTLMEKVAVLKKESGEGQWQATQHHLMEVLMTQPSQAFPVEEFQKTRAQQLGLERVVATQ